MSSATAQTPSPTSSPSTTSSRLCTLSELRKSSVFTSSLPSDPLFPTPESSHAAPRTQLGPRIVRGGLFTYVRPTPVTNPELLRVSPAALRDLGLLPSEAETESFRALVSGNHTFWTPPPTPSDSSEGKSSSSESKDDQIPTSHEKGIYPWAQSYGGYQFGNWASQLGDGRAISLVELTAPHSGIRYELALKGCGRTPYSRFADGLAVLRSSIREFVASEYLNALRIPTTRALALTLTPDVEVRREKMEPGAIVARFAQSWIRIGTFDLLRHRGDRVLLRKLADYVAENVFGGWETLEAEPFVSTDSEVKPAGDENRYYSLYRKIVRENALTVAKWQSVAFCNGVLNSDNTSIMGLSVDFGPFAFLDNFERDYTPNHDDHHLRYSYRNQPTVIWWNLVRLGEDLGELIGVGDRVDSPEFVEKGLREEDVQALVERAERLITKAGEEYQSVLTEEYQRLIALRLGFTTRRPEDAKLVEDLLDSMEDLELDFNHFFRRLSDVKVQDVSTPKDRETTAHKFFHKEGTQTSGTTEEAAFKTVAEGLDKWRVRILEESQSGSDPQQEDAERQKAMKATNPNFVPRGWVLEEIIKRVTGGEREVLKTVMALTLKPFEDCWPELGEEGQKDAQRWCGDVPRAERGLMCSCSS